MRGIPASEKKYRGIKSDGIVGFFKYRGILSGGMGGQYTFQRAQLFV